LRIWLEKAGWDRFFLSLFLSILICVMFYEINTKEFPGMNEARGVVDRSAFDLGYNDEIGSERS
jgi:hypothetical protein